MPFDTDEHFGKRLSMEQRQQRETTWKRTATIDIPHTMFMPTYFVLKPTETIDSFLNWPFLKDKAVWQGRDEGNALTVAERWANMLGSTIWVGRVTSGGRHLVHEIFPDVPREQDEYVFEDAPTANPDAETPGFGEF